MKEVLKELIQNKILIIEISIELIEVGYGIEILISIIV
tara:strand:- start:598 stop:711 length:114 start_codon:yes stop_codon:yes gene_type:complete